MIRRGPVALIYPYFRTAAPEQHLFQPLGIAALSAQLKARGIPAHQHDCTFQSFDAVADRIVLQRPSIVGISVMVTMSRNAFALVRSLRSRLPGTLFVAGGPMPTLYPGRFSRHFDVVFRGESDISFPRFCRDYLAARRRQEFLGHLDPARYRGIFLIRPSGPARSAPVHHGASVIDSLALPDRAEGDHARYHAFWEEKDGSRPATVMLTRGCPYHCDFCSKPVFGDRFRTRALVSVMKETEEIVRLGYNRLWIADDSFTLDRPYLRSFCAALLRSGQGLSWSCLSRVDSLDGATTRLMKQAGCTKVYLGLESGSDETLRRMNKRATVGQGIRAVHHFNDAGIRVGGFFIVGYPGESVEDTEKTFRLALSLPLDEVSFNVPFPLPGSPLFDRVAGVDPDADWDMENETRFLFRSDFDEAWLRRRIAETRAAFRQGRQGPAGPAS